MKFHMIEKKGKREKKRHVFGIRYFCEKINFSDIVSFRMFNILPGMKSLAISIESMETLKIFLYQKNKNYII